MTEKKKIRILIADDFKAMRDVIRMCLAKAGDFDIVGEAPELDQAIEQAKELQPDVVLMNDYLPPVDSALATAIFREQGIRAAILSLSIETDSELIDRAFRVGINGFMHKDEIDQYLEDAVRSVHRGEIYISPKIQEAHKRRPGEPLSQ
jgi:two-component system, NarL family, response regulator DegU